MSNENTVDKVKLISELKEIHSELFQVYSKLFDFKYKHDEEVKLFIDNEYKENGVGSKEQKAWNDNFCHRASYTLLNKILFVRICEDKGFMRNTEDYIAGEVKDPHIGEKLSKIGLQKWNRLITNYTLGELIRFAFRDMKQSYRNIVLYKEDKYEKLNPIDEEFSLKYIDGDEVCKNLILEFENVLNNIIEKLDTNNFNFKYTDGNILGDVYEKFMDRETRKAIGQFYTPEFVIEYILKNTLEEVDVVKNPFVTVADISCGSGHFLIMAYDILKEKFLINLEILKEKYSEKIYQMKKDGKEIKLTGREYWVKEHIHYHILKNCIYGADIDSFAVQLTTINLLLKDLDNFTDELNTIQCDSLIKWDQDYEWKDLKEQLTEKFETIQGAQYNLLGEEEKVLIKHQKENYQLKVKDSIKTNKVETIKKERAEEIVNICEFWSKKFDYIVGNPPYVRQENINNKSYLSRNYKVYNSISDLLTYFIERGMHLLKKEGKLGVIVSDKFTRANYGQQLREYLRYNYTLLAYKDNFEESSKVFEDAVVDAAVLIVNNLHPLEGSEFNFNDKIILKQEDLDNKGWYFLNDQTMKIKRKVELKGIKIKNIDDITINRGITTGFNEAFIIDSKTKKEICKNNPENKKWIKKILRGRDIDKYSCSWDNLWLLFIPWHFPLHEDQDINGVSVEAENCFKKDYEEIYEHLLKYKYDLMDRNKAETGIRYEWYALQRFASTYYKDFEKDKIIFANMSIENRFYYDEEKYYCNQKAFILTSDVINLKYLSGLLNSNLLFFYFRLITPKLQGETREYSKVFINEIPIIIENKYEKEISELVEILLDKDVELEDTSCNKYLEYQSKKMKQKSQKEIAKLLIDQYIYKSYDLSPMEIKFIENNIPQKLTFEKIFYLSKLEENEVISTSFFAEHLDTFVKEAGKKLNAEKLYEEYVLNNKSLEEISEQYGFMITTILALYEQYLEEFYDSNPLKFCNFSELIIKINKQLIEHIYSILEKENRYLELDKIKQSCERTLNNIDEMFNIVRQVDNTKKSINIIKDALIKDVLTWNAYIKAKLNNKGQNKTFIKYYDSTYYGLSEWTDEIHKKYFMDAIDEYTVNSPNEKKANDILKSFKELDIEDKEDYLDIIEEKIKRAFS